MEGEANGSCERAPDDRLRGPAIEHCKGGHGACALLPTLQSYKKVTSDT